MTSDKSPEISMVRKDAGNISLVTSGVASEVITPVVSPMHPGHTTNSISSAHNQRSHVSTGGKSGVAGASFNLLNATIGAGVVALPYAIKECGFIMGTILLIVLGLVIDKCIIMLIECGIKVGKYNLEEICLLLFGPVGYNLACIFMFLYSYGSMIACMVVIGDTLPWTLNTLFDLNMNIFTREVVMILSAVLVVLPLSLLKDVSTLSSASLLSVVAVCILVMIVALHGPHEASRQGLVFNVEADLTFVKPNILSGIATISFHYVCQQSCFLMFRSLEQPTLAQWKRVSHYTIGFTLAMSLLIGVCGYVYFTGTVRGNILNNFPEFDSIITVARLFMAINMILTIPMECFIVRHAIFSICNRYYPLKDRPQPLDINSSTHSAASSTSWGSASYVEQDGEEFSDGSSWSDIRPVGGEAPAVAAMDGPPPDNDETEWNHTAHVLATIALWSSTLGFALVFEDVSVVLAFSGILAASALGYILPAAIYLQANRALIRQLLERKGVLAPSTGPPLEWNNSTQLERGGVDAGESASAHTAGEDNLPADLVGKFLFSAFLGSFGVFMLVVGLVMEIYYLSRGDEYVDPVTNY